MGNIKGISWFKISSEIHINEFKEYAKNMQSFLDKHLKSMEEDYDKRSLGLSNDEKVVLFQVRMKMTSTILINPFQTF